MKKSIYIIFSLFMLMQFTGCKPKSVNKDMPKKDSQNIKQESKTNKQQARGKKGFNKKGRKQIKKVIVKSFKPKLVVKNAIYNAFITPKRAVYLLPQVSGLITRLSFDMGDVVKKGKLLAVIDTSMTKIDLDLKKIMMEEAETQKEYLKKLFDKDKVMLEKNIINKDAYDASKNRLDTAEFAYKKARIAYRLSKITYDRSFIYAPFDGVITQRNKQKGDLASMSTPLGHIIDHKNLEVVIGVLWEDLKTIQSYSKGKEIKVVAPDQGVCMGKIDKVSQVSDPSTKLYSIKLALSSCDLVNDTQVKVVLPIREYENAYEVDRGILEIENGKYYLFVHRKGVAVRTQVQLMEDNAKKMIIRIPDLKTETVEFVVDGHIGLINNEKVQIIGDEKMESPRTKKSVKQETKEK